MRRIMGCCVLIIVLVIPSPGQYGSGTDLNITGGAVFPVSPEVFENYWRIGFSGGIGPSFRISNSLRFGAYYNYNIFTFDGFKFRELSQYRGRMDITVDGKSSTLSSGTLYIKYSPIPENNYPGLYLTAGVGYGRLDIGDILVDEAKLVDDDVVFTTDSLINNPEWAPLTTLGVGFDVPGDKFPKLFFEFRYGIAFTRADTTQYIMLLIGLRFQLI